MPSSSSSKKNNLAFLLALHRLQLVIVDAFVRSEFEISSWRGARVGVRTYLLGGAIDGSEANGIYSRPNVEIREFIVLLFDFRLLVMRSVDVVVGEKWRVFIKVLRERRKRTKEDTRSRRSTKEDELRLCDIFVVLQGATPICEGSCRLTSLERQEVWNDCRSCKVRVGSNGNLLWEASVLLGRKKGGVRVAREDDHGVTKGREDVREVFQQRRSGAKRNLSRCRRNQLGNEPILALPEGADDFVVYYDARSKDLEACLEKGRSFGVVVLTNCTLVGGKKSHYAGWNSVLKFVEIKDDNIFVLSRKPLSFVDDEKSVVPFSYSSTNKAFQVTEDPPSRIHPVNLEFLDPVVQCLINLLQSAVTEIVDLIEAHDHLNPIFIPKCDGSWRVNYCEIVLVLKASCIPSGFGEV
ncbi:hypothetical protein Tco_1244305 [Tanacetum coccineum]